MNSNFDLNLQFISNATKFLFDLNQNPTDEKIVEFNNKDDDANGIDQIASNDCFRETNSGKFFRSNYFFLNILVF